MTEKIGYLDINIGPMWAGKSSELIRDFDRITSVGVDVLVLNYVEKRYGEDIISTHKKIKINAYCLMRLMDIVDTEMYKNTKYIVVDEAQFFTDLFEFTLKAVEQDSKYVKIYGLSGDSDRKKFGQILDLIPFADKLNLLSAFCKLCKGKLEHAHFTKRIVESKEQVLIGSDESYIPVCRYHYLNS